MSFSDPRSLVTTYVRNGFGDVIRQTSPDTGITDYVYDARGLVTQITDARSVVTQFTYDAAGRLLTRSYPAATSENVTYTWDSTTGGNAGKGRLTGVTDESGTHSRFYDPRGNLLQDNRVIAGRSYATTYTYDSADRIASITYPSGRIITYTRDTSGRITGITTRETSVAPVFTVASGISWQPMAGMAGDNPPSAGTATQLQALPGLDGFGSVDLLQALTYGNELQQWKTFTTDNEVDLIQLYNGSTVVTQRDIDRQDGMNVTGIADAITPANNQNFGYSDAARLTTASGPYGARSWTYDGVGNRTGETIAGVSTVWSYVNGTNRLSTVVQGATTQRSFTYDTAGNITQDLRGATTYVYGINKAGRLSTLTVGGTARATYTYDAFGRLAIRALVNGTPSGTTHVLWDQDGHVIAEHTAAGAVVREYVWLNDQPITVFDASTAPTKQYAVHVDQLDRPVRMTDASKAVVWDAYYEPFGGVVSLTGPAALDLRLPGQWFQIEAGLAYNWHRHYDPTLGRYTQPDPLGVDAGASLYGYAGQSPQMNVDPDGRFWQLFVGAVIGGGIELGSQYFLEGRSYACLDRGRILRSAAFGALLGAYGRSLSAGLAPSAVEGGAASAATAGAAGSRALVPAVDAVYATATERMVAGYTVWGNAGRVGSTYAVNVLGLYATKGSQGLGALAAALRAEAAAAGASRISIQGIAIVNKGLAGLSARAAARFGLQLERINANTIILSGGL